MTDHNDPRQRSPSVARNRHVILEVLRPRLPEAAHVLEIGSGSGEHAVAFAAALPKVTWTPSDPSKEARASIAAWTSVRALPNVRPPLELDVEDPGWAARASAAATTAGGFEAVVSINMIHITPPSTVAGLLSGAAALLSQGGLLILYGPFRRNGRHTAPSNEEFDRWLKDRHPSFGIRDLGEVEAAANAEGLELKEVVEMPANNFSVFFRRR